MIVIIISIYVFMFQAISNNLLFFLYLWKYFSLTGMVYLYKKER